MAGSRLLKVGCTVPFILSVGVPGQPPWAGHIDPEVEGGREVPASGLSRGENLGSDHSFRLDTSLEDTAPSTKPSVVPQIDMTALESQRLVKQSRVPPRLEASAALDSPRLPGVALVALGFGAAAGAMSGADGGVRLMVLAAALGGAAMAAGILRLMGAKKGAR